MTMPFNYELTEHFGGTHLRINYGSYPVKVTFSLDEDGDLKIRSEATDNSTTAYVPRSEIPAFLAKLNALLT